jgi:glucosyl-dolichyl phosphate glucuronosyltransferase
MNPPEVSIIICTRNRATQLAPTLASVVASKRASKLASELVVVDNGSSDDTRSVVRSAKEAWGSDGIEYLVVAEPGQCRARNAGICKAQGQVLLWTDDDVRVPLDWIDRMCLPLLGGKIDATQGGFVLPELLTSHAIFRTGALGPKDDSGLGLPDSEPTMMVGLNMAMHRRVLERVPQFDSDLGPGALGFYDDTLFGWQLKEAGFRIRKIDGAQVIHDMDAERLSGRYAIEVYRRLGRSEGFVAYHWLHSTPKTGALGRCYRLATLAVASVIEWASGRLASVPSKRYLEAVRLASRAGEWKRLQHTERKYELRGLCPRKCVEMARAEQSRQSVSP